MVDFGIDRRKLAVSSAEANGRGADTAYSHRIMQNFLDPIAKVIEEYNKETSPGKMAKYRSLIRLLDPYKVAYFGLRGVLNHFMKEEPLASLGTNIGTMLEDELKFSIFHEQHGDYFETIMTDFKKRGTKSYRHMHRVLTKKAADKEVKWNSWTKAERCMVGIKVIDLIIASTDLIVKAQGPCKGKRVKTPPTIIKPTQACLDWVNGFNEYDQLLYPDRIPCIIKPDPWVSVNQGGYYSPQLRSRTPLVKTRDRDHRVMLADSDMSVTLDAVNALQDTAWTINKELYEVLVDVWDKCLPVGLPRSQPIDIPISPVVDIDKNDMTDGDKKAFMSWKEDARIAHTLERERVSKCFQVIRVLRLAREFSEYDKLWFVHQCDFRGRVYCTVSGLSPQGTDFGKAVLKFADGKELGKQGSYWFKVHGANTFGIDKIPYSDRVKWVDSNSNLLEQIAIDPMSNREHWANASKPWQFLAWCQEYKEYLIYGDKYVSHLPVALDGSCNGLQNFSALFRDEVGGTATNLLDSKSPLDIYKQVSEVCTRKLRELPESHESLEWLRLADKTDGVLTRSLSKRPVMTLPYGSTRQSCREYIHKYILEDTEDHFQKEDRFMMSVFLTPILWASISEVVVAARSAMDWLQQCSVALARGGYGTLWSPPNKFPVYQARKKVVSRQIHTELVGHFRLRLDTDIDEVSVQKQLMAAAPNFVHSLDACHLMFTVNQAKGMGINSFACIHDDFGTHACDTAKFHRAIRESFLRMYTESDPVKDFIKTNLHDGIILPEPPTIGTLDLTKITEAKYFFG